MLHLEAKRLRPALTLMACNMFSDNIKPAIYPALAIEVFHNFTLMHDDIMDNSDLRRKNETVHVKWNKNIALLSGDAMVIKAYELLFQEKGLPLLEILPVFNQTALQVCEGQQFDMDYEKRMDVSIDEYLQMVEYKTAALVAGSLKIGAIIGRAAEKDAGRLYEFGRNIGIAFQLQDDLLDVFADEAIFGKVTGNDIVSNKKTILLIEALNRTKGELKVRLLDWIKRTEFVREEKVQAVKMIYAALSIEELVKDKIQCYHDRALENLSKVNIDPDRKKELEKFSAYLMNRKK
jgi:geranylgeranyl diphosphate synthase type II